MKVLQSKPISTFGGLNFVLEHLENQGIGDFLNQKLPELKAQSHYSWKDVLYALLSIYLCGGDCIEDLQTHLKSQFGDNPFVKIPSPDTVLKRLSELSVDTQNCRTKRGVVEHEYNVNAELQDINIKLLKKLGVFEDESMVLDYDNTILFNEKKDSRMTYKHNPGYQPGVCTVNENHILSIENRNGNSDAKSFQDQTLTRIFDALKSNGVRKPDHFRADSASYQYDIIQLLEKEVNHFYIGCPNRYVEKHFSKVTEWVSLDPRQRMEVGEVNYYPFGRQAEKQGKQVKVYRLIVKRCPNKSGQINLLTQDAYDYRAIVTNNFEKDLKEVAQFYNHRGNMERQFDIMKNDFGWNLMPFSSLDKNLVFLYFTAICRNLYHQIIHFFSKKIKFLKSTFRVKRFLFRFILLPAKWVRRSGQWHLRTYGKINYKT